MKQYETKEQDDNNRRGGIALGSGLFQRSVLDSTSIELHPRPVSCDQLYESPHHFINTVCGRIKVTVQGNPKNPVIITYHDVGLNHKSCFEGFLSYEGNAFLGRDFCMYHIDAPGQEDNAKMFEGDYPSTDQLTEQVHEIVTYFGIKGFIGLGAGLGSYLMLNYTVQHPSKVIGLVLVSPDASAASMYEYTYYKAGILHVKANHKRMTKFYMDMLLNRYFSGYTLHNNLDLMDGFKYVLTDCSNAYNSALLLNSFIRRKDITNAIQSIRCHTLIVGGTESQILPQVEQVTLKLPRLKSSYIKIPFCGCLVQEESPDVFKDALLCFFMSLTSYLPSSLINKLQTRMMK